jgi:hypothetical protein
MSTVAPGNKTHIFPEPSPNSNPSREDGIVSRTRKQAFEDHGINNPASFYGGGGSGHQNSIHHMTHSAGKDHQESYRSGLSRSREAHDRVADR